MVSMLAFCSDDPSSNPADVYSFSVKFVIENKGTKQNKEAEDGPFFLKKTDETCICENSKLSIYIIIFIGQHNMNNIIPSCQFTIVRNRKEEEKSLKLVS